MSSAIRKRFDGYWCRTCLCRDLSVIDRGSFSSVSSSHRDQIGNYYCGRCGVYNLIQLVVGSLWSIDDRCILECRRCGIVLCEFHCHYIRSIVASDGMATDICDVCLMKED